jgi:hypothetical protein
VTDLSLFRIYEPHELGKDGYPHVWHSGLIAFEDLNDGEYIADYATKISWEHLDPDVHGGIASQQVGVKHVVRMQAGHRCVRCGHPYIVGKSAVIGEADELHPLRTQLETGFRQETLDKVFEERIADGLDSPDVTDGRRTLWSPCDERCTHGGPIRVGDDPASILDIRWRTTDLGPELGPTRLRASLALGDGFVEAAWRILTVHHLNGVKPDLRWWNLIPVCQRCHLYLQRVVVMERVYPFEHDDYFKPYAAGWYASTYLKEDLTRQETMERLDELLALERMA